MITRAAALILSVGVTACGGDGGARDSAASDGSLTGAGATFPNPIYTRWFTAYHDQTGARINYQSIGSGGGIRQFTERTVAFGATDGPMTDAQIQAVSGNVAHIPTVIGAVVMTYNLPALAGDTLRLDGETIAAIYLGEITQWNDPQLAALNPGVALPDRDIIVVHRSDGSGTTFVFTDYLAKVSPEWKANVGTNTSVDWPIGLGGKGNEGVTQQIKQTEGAIGYVEQIYARANGLPMAAVRNAAGNFVMPSLESLTAAAAGELSDTTDFRISITNPETPDAYPISSFTWLLIRPENPDTAAARMISDFLTWMISPEAQQMAADIGYAPLPDRVVELVRERLAGL